MGNFNEVMGEISQIQADMSRRVEDLRQENFYSCASELEEFSGQLEQLLLDWGWE